MKWDEEKDKLGKEIILDLYKKGMIRTWYKDNPKGWVLVSGIWSPFYIQLRPLSSHPELLKKTGYALGKLIKEECKGVDRVVGIAMTGIPISTAISIIEGIPSCFTRKLEGVKTLEDFDGFLKMYGEHSMVEGELISGDTIAIVDDLVTKFDSKLIAIKQLEVEVKIRKLSDVKFSDVVALLDREQGAEETAKRSKINLHSLIPFKSKGLLWLKEVFADEEYNVISDYLKDSEKYQDPKLQGDLADITIRGGKR